MTSTPAQRSCASFHREQHRLRSPFTEPQFFGGPDNRYLTVAVQHCSFRGEHGPARLRLTVHTPEGDAYLDLPTYMSDDLSRRLRGLSTVAEDLDGLDGYHASRYKGESDDCNC